MKNINWENYRDLYPFLRDKTYLKSASITPLNPQVLSEIQTWNTSIAEQAAIGEERFFDLLMETRSTLASFLHCEEESVTLLENSSHNFNMIAMMLKKELLAGKNQVIMAEDEFPSSILPFYYHGFDVIKIPCPNGIFKNEDIRNFVTDKTCAFISSHVQFFSGRRIDLSEQSQICLDLGIHFFVNATQSIGVFPIDLKKTPVTGLTASCHKWLGAGLGQAVFYLNPAFKMDREFPLAGWCSVAEPFEMRNEPPIPREDLGAMQLGTLPFACIAGVKKAIEVVTELSLNNINERILNLSSELRSEVEKIGIKTLGPTNRDCQSGIVTFPLENANEFEAYCKERNIFINVRRGHVRASIHIFNNREDIENFASTLSEWSKKS